MSFFDSLMISIFGLGMVFAILVALSAVISLQSKVFSLFSKKEEYKPAVETSGDYATEVIVNEAAGQLKLIDVDERTAAMIMAIVSDESQIPLSELNFKYIKALD